MFAYAGREGAGPTAGPVLRRMGPLKSLIILKRVMEEGLCGHEEEHDRKQYSPDRGIKNKMLPLGIGILEMWFLFSKIRSSFSFNFVSACFDT